MNNQQLRQLYERVYAEGKEKFFTFSTDEISREVLSELDWEGLDVLEVGCGTGETAYLMASAGAKVYAADYAESAISEARDRHSEDGLRFDVLSLYEVEGQYDVVVAQEVLEHVDDPRLALATLRDRLRPDGLIIATCPSFLNLRGYVWMTLLLLLDVPMSLSDVSYICPFNMEEWAGELGLECEWRTIRHSVGYGELLRVDMKKRLTNALRDAGLDNSKVDGLLDWLDRARQYEVEQKHNGAAGLYRFRIREQPEA